LSICDEQLVTICWFNFKTVYLKYVTNKIFLVTGPPFRDLWPPGWWW